MCETSEIFHQKFWPKMALPTRRGPPKTNKTMEKQPFEDVSPMKKMLLCQLAILVFRGFIWCATFSACLSHSYVTFVTFEVLPWWCFYHMRMEFRSRRCYHRVLHQSYVPNMTVLFTIHEKKNDSKRFILRKIFCYYLYILVLRIQF